jgi:DNA-binding MarR family transcriptional regulator
VRSEASTGIFSTHGALERNVAETYDHPASPFVSLYIRGYNFGVVERPDIVGAALFAMAGLAVRHLGRELSLTATSTLATVERTGPRRLTDLAVNEGVTQPSMTAVVSQLERLGFAERRGDPNDGRVVLVAITGAGERQLARMRQAGAAEFTTLIEKLTDSEAAALSAAVPAFSHLLDLAGEHQAGGRATTGRPGLQPNRVPRQVRPLSTT